MAARSASPQTTPSARNGNAAGSIAPRRSRVSAVQGRYVTRPGRISRQMATSAEHDGKRDRERGASSAGRCENAMPHQLLSARKRTCRSNAVEREDAADQREQRHRRADIERPAEQPRVAVEEVT